MTATPIHPATHDEFLRILGCESERSPVLHEGSVEEFLRIVGISE